MNKIKVLLADDHPVVREGIRAILSTTEHIEIVGEASDGEEAVRQASELLPDVVLMDISMPHLDGIEATKHLHEAVPRVKVIALTMHENDEYVLEIIRSGARGYVLKDTSPAELLRAVETVHSGGTYLSTGVSQVLADDYVRQSGEIDRSGKPRLSRREQEVLALIAEGFNNREIAGRLSVGVRTIETHRERIMRKLDIHTAAGLTRYAISRGIVKLR